MFQNVGTSSVVNHQVGTENNGFIQTEVINTQDLSNYGHIFISMWAVNRVSWVYCFNYIMANVSILKKKSYYLFILYHTGSFVH